MKKGLFLIIAAVILFSCNNKVQQPVTQEQKPSDQVFQYSLFTALANSVYDGSFTVADVKQKGDIGLGTYNGLNGEMIVCNGKVYHCQADGSIVVAEDSELVPFTVLKFFESDKSMEINEIVTYPELQNRVSGEFVSPNIIYAFKIHGAFEYLKCGSADKQQKPYTNTLSKAIANRPVFEWENISGTMVGFWFPEYIGGVNLPGFHLHFISDDEQKAGHVMEFRASNLEVGIDMSDGLQFLLPENDAFKTTVFDLSQGYNR